MSRYQTILTVIVAAATALSLAAPLRAGADPGGSSSVHEYVVVYAEGPRAAESAIRKAGGRIVDVNERLGVAKVATTDRGFVTKARRAAGIRSVVLNHAIGTSKPGMPHRFAAERPTRSDKSIGARAGKRNEDARRSTEPLSNMQWNMTMMDADQAHERATGRGVDVGIIDTGIDGTHPDLATNFDQSRSRNFTQDIPAIDGPCENPTCIDPANTDGDGHGTHVAGIVAADDDRFGIGGVAPDATLVNLRAGQDSGYFFLYETVAALVEAGDLQLDVVNMSFYTDPWMYNCASRADYISGDVTDEEVAQQATTRQLVLNAVSYAHDRGVTLLAAAGNDHTNLATPIREDLTSPDYPPGSERRRVVTNNCLDLPAEAPQVISVSAVGPSTTKADYSNYGYGDVEVSAPGGWFRDTFGTPTFQVPSNLILSAYPLELAIEQELADENGVPTDDFSVQYCTRGVCGFYTYLQGTSMASPHAAGVAALIIDRYGRATGRGGKALDPEVVRRILEESAVDHRCPAGGVEDYTQEGRPADWNAACEGTTDENGFYGEGIVNAARAVAASPQHLS